MHTGTSESGRRNPPRDGEPPWSSFGLFTETLFTGVLVAAASVLLVTFLPAMAAGTSRLRRHLNGDADTVAIFASDLRSAWRSLWPLAVGTPVMVGLLVVNTILVGGGDVPGGGAMAAVMGVMALMFVVVSLRAAGEWRPQVSPRIEAVVDGRATGRGPAVQESWKALAEAGRRSARDPVGSLLVVAAIGMCVVLAWMLLPLVALAPGLLALALVAVEQRFHSRHALERE